MKVPGRIYARKCVRPAYDRSGTPKTKQCRNVHFSRTIVSGPKRMGSGFAWRQRTVVPCSRDGAPKGVISSPSATREPSVTPGSLRFPKSARILRSADFRRVYEHGQRFSGPYFAAFLLALERDRAPGPRIGFTVPRAFGVAVRRNRAKRRLREQLRLRLGDIAPQWDIVVNPRRQVLDATPDELRREVDRLIR